MSNSSYLDSTVNIQTDIGKYFIDQGTADVDSLFTAPRPDGHNRQLRRLPAVAGLDRRRSWPASRPTMWRWGRMASTIRPTSSSRTTTPQTSQLSQEFRLDWNPTDSLNLVGGVQYWQERVDKWDINSTTVARRPRMLPVQSGCAVPAMMHRSCRACNDFTPD